MKEIISNKLFIFNERHKEFWGYSAIAKSWVL